MYGADITLDGIQNLRKLESEKLKNLYKRYLLQCLCQDDIDEMIDNPPMEYQQFIERLKGML